MTRTSLRRSLQAVLAAVLLWGPSTFAVAAYQLTDANTIIQTKATANAQAALRDAFANAELTVLTAVNEQNGMTGYRINADGSLHGYYMALGTNPAFQMFDWENVVPLTSGKVKCSKVFIFTVCVNQNAYGMYQLEDGSLASDFATSTHTNFHFAGTVPYAYFPGSFVEENDNDLIASTQQGVDAQYVVVLNETMAEPVVISELPWVVGINDNSPPQLLGYLDDDAACAFVRCDWEPVCGDDEHEHDNGGYGHVLRYGRGHYEHGNGYGYGHHDHDCESVENDQEEYESDLLSLATGSGSVLKSLAYGGFAAASYSASAVTYSDAVLVHVDPATGEYALYHFAQQLGDGGKIENLYPLAINKTHAVLRGDVKISGQTYQGRLLSCAFDAANIDINGDSLVDCAGGLQLIGTLGAPNFSHTIAGFSLENNGLLSGNFGLNAVGVGLPFVMNIYDAEPHAVLLNNSVNRDAGWELNIISDINSKGKMTGYGFRDCGVAPEGYTVDVNLDAAATTPHFVITNRMVHTIYHEGDTVALDFPVTGANGEAITAEYRTSVKTPGDGEWAVISDWSGSAGSLDTTPYPETVCVRVEARESGAVEAQEIIMRYASVEAANVPVYTGFGTDVDAADVSDSLLPFGALPFDRYAVLMLLLMALRYRERQSRV